MPSVSVPLPAPLVAARFVRRPNRFVVQASLEDGASGEPVDCHLPDPGRLRELLLPDARLWLRAAGDPGRRTAWSVVLVEGPDGAGPISVDTTLPNRLIRRALEQQSLQELAGWRLERAEPAVGRSRFDFLLSRGTERLLLEVKSVTLVQDGVALFPDAVTARGARHVRELAELAGEADRHAVVLFVLQRPDAREIRAARSIDPAFADALEAAAAAGVRVLGRRCRVDRHRVTLGDPVPTVVG